MRRVAILLVGASLAGCAGRDLRDLGATRFDAIMPFVPPATESLMLVDFTVPSDLTTNCPFADFLEQAPARMALAGGQFRLRGPSYGDWEGVVLLQWQDARTAGERSLSDTDRVEVAGRSVWFAPGGEHGGLESWIVWLDDRTLLVATRRAVLERALAAQGAAAESAAARLGWSDGIDWNAPVLIFRRFDPTNAMDCYSPKGSPLGNVPAGPEFEGFRLAITQTGDGAVTMSYCARTGHADQARAWFAHHTKGARRGRDRRILLDRYEQGRLTLVESYAREHLDWLWLSWSVLFGFNVFI